ncbi:hypothetical protein [Cribrihabitans pelagius]|uniref:hypothetical protein n=1 Tax=Cribrihabitans pelagius TaxID=1765746 RepID=UPI003B5C613A
MQLIKFTSILPAIAIMAACGMNPPGATMTNDTAPTDARAILAGKTLVHPDITMTLLQSGQLKGVAPNGNEIIGTWAIKSNQWCRTLEKPAKFSGTACRDFTIEGDQVTMTRPDGQSAVFTLQ